MTLWKIVISFQHVSGAGKKENCFNIFGIMGTGWPPGWPPDWPLDWPPPGPWLSSPQRISPSPATTQTGRNTGTVRVCERSEWKIVLEKREVLSWREKNSRSVIKGMCWTYWEAVKEQGRKRERKRKSERGRGRERQNKWLRLSWFYWLQWWIWWGWKTRRYFVFH